MATSRLGGDFDFDALEAFRDAYAAQMQTPEDLDTDRRMGLPSNEISNTAPWIHTTGLWKYPSGKGPESDLKAPFDPNQYFTREPETVDLADLTEEELDAYLDTLSEEEILALSAELESEFMDDEGEEEGMSEEEIENLISELQGE
jgi:hypothetical protein